MSRQIFATTTVTGALGWMVQATQESDVVVSALTFGRADENTFRTMLIHRSDVDMNCRFGGGYSIVKKRIGLFDSSIVYIS